MVTTRTLAAAIEGMSAASSADGLKLPATPDGSAHKSVTTDGIAGLVDVSGKVDKTTTISAGTGLTGGGDLSAGRTLALDQATQDKLAAIDVGAARRAAIAAGKIPHIAFFGDSITDNMGAWTICSPLFYAWAHQPRLVHFDNRAGTDAVSGDNLAVAGSKSGTLTDGAGSTVWTAVETYGANSPDMNTAIIKSRLAALAPDILFAIGPANDQGTNPGPYDSFLNYKAVVEAADPAYFIFLPVLPHDTGHRSIYEMLALMQAWERDDPRIRVLDPWAAYVDDTTNSAAAAGLTMDGLHPGPAGARALATIYAKALDDIGVRRTDYRGVSQAGAFDDATMPYGNQLGAAGAMGGTGGTVGDNATGVVATGWSLSTYDPSLTVVGSKSTISVVDEHGATISHTAQQVDITAASTLTGQQIVHLSKSGWLGPAEASEAIVSALAQITNLKGCIGLKLAVVGTGGLYSIGNTVNGTTAGAELPADLDEVLRLAFPGTVAIAGGKISGIDLDIYFRAGTPAGALGTVKLAQVNMSRVPDALPTAP